jgi:hypothetical protein
MSDSLIGIDASNSHVWEAHPIIEYGEETGWLGTGLDDLFVTFPSTRETLNYFIGRYPGVTGVHCTIKKRYEHINLSEAARTIMLDGIMKKLERKEPDNVQ